MSVQDIAGAQALLEEIQRRAVERALQDYVPSAPQQKFHKSGAHLRLMTGANVTGKSTALVTEAIATALGYRPWTGERLKPPPTRSMLVVASFTHSSGEDVTPLIDKYLPPSQLLGVDRLANGKRHKWTLKNGSIIKLMSFEQAIIEFEGTGWDLIGFNEPPPYAIYTACVRGAAKRNGRLAFAMTPVGVNAGWVFTRIIQGQDKLPGEVDVITADMDKGESFLTEDALRKFKSQIDPDEYAARVHGEFKQLQGRVYKQFDEDRHVIKGDALARVRALIADPTVPKGLVTDPHDRKPFAMAWFLVTPAGERVFFHEWPEYNFDDARGCEIDVSGYADLIRKTEADLGISPVAWRLIDPNFGVQRRVVSLESIRDRFDREGLCFDSDIDDRIEAGHLAVKALLNENLLLIAENCANMRRAICLYCWADGRDSAGNIVKEKPEESGKDFCDLIRYMAMSVGGYYDPTPRTWVDPGKLVP